MNLAITLVHNKSDQENVAQIVALKSLIETNEEFFDEYDEQGNVVGSYTSPFYTLKGLNIEHRVKFLQIVPFGVTQPPNLYQIDSHKVFYAKGDEDKTGDHPRFFNWGLKRGTDLGADISLYIDNYKSFDIKKLATKLQKLYDKNDTTEYIEDGSCKAGTVKLIKEVGLLREDVPLDIAVTNLKGRVTMKGLKHG